MCGLVGFIAYSSSAPPNGNEGLLRACEQMIHRGPDDAGLWLAGDRRVGLGHRRLSIVDLSGAAAQPMASLDGQYRIVFNGEIYNHRVLRSELEARGVVFQSHSDTEVLLALYAECGVSLLQRLRGMFAFAIWDDRERSLFLARDAYGIKPLYYADDGQTLAVASQVKALVAGGWVSLDVDPVGVAGFYLFGSVPEPFTSLRGVRALPAGCWLRVREGRVEGPKRWYAVSEAWQQAAREGSRPASTAEANASMVAALRDSVEHHLVADVPVGAFLSAGIDSGALAGLMAEAGQPPQTITVAFDEFLGAPQDEAPLAAEVAAHYGLTQQVHRVNEGRFRADWPRIVAAMDQPSIDGVNTWYASEAARLAGLKVAVSGLGGDELFGGYPAFRDLPRWTRWLGPWARIPGLGQAVRQWGQALMASPLGAGFAHLSPKALSVLEYAGSWPGAWLLRRGLFMPWELPALMGEEAARAGLEGLRPLALIHEAMLPDPGTAFGRVAALESALYMRNQLLRDADWAGMAHSIEIRVPLVDTVLLGRVAPVLLSFADPTGIGKQVLATAPARALPDSIRLRPKTGFTVPFADWLQNIDGLDVWRRVPDLVRPGCHWSRRFAYALVQNDKVWGRG